MITASEPMEFIPRGRKAVDEHPGPLVLKKPATVPSDFILLQRMQDVNISLDESPSEFYTIREIYSELDDGGVDIPGFMLDANVNTEEELYVKGNTAVWSKGINSDETAPHVCLTCDNPIKFAFFCPREFLNSDDTKAKPDPGHENNTDQSAYTGVCLLDGSTLKVYCSNGENFISSLECPISNVWITKSGVLFEKEPSSTVLEAHSIQMPRLFSLTHPLDEMCPVLIKMNNSVTYLTEAEYRLVFTCEENNLVLMFDEKAGRHFICMLRKATDDEKNTVGCGNDSVCYSSSAFNISTSASQHMISVTSAATPQSFYKSSLLARHSASTAGRPSLGVTISSPYANSLHVGQIGSFNLNTSGVGSTNRSFLQPQHQSMGATPLSRLQSTLGGSASLLDVRKIGQAEPSKPIVPEYCLDHIWTDQANTEFNEMASLGFLHVDLIENNYLCYLLPRTEKLSLVRIGKSLSSSAISASTSSVQIPAKDAVSLKRMNMIAVLAPCGTLMLYTGPVHVGKVHVGGILSSLVTSSALSASFGSSQGFRRSSLLPSVLSQTDTRFDEELHMLSPVQPLHHGPNVLSPRMTNCQGIRDGSGNRLTLSFASEKMFRISLPVMSESHLVSRCLVALRETLEESLALDVMIRWYGTRNAPGSRDFNGDREWKIFREMLFQSIGRPFPPTSELDRSQTKSSFVEPKKRRKSENCMGSDNDWEYLMAHSGQKHVADDAKKSIPPLAYDSTKQLFVHLPNILFKLHLLYEDMKLEPLLENYLKMLAEFLYELTLDLKLEIFQLHYFLDFQHLAHLRSHCSIRNEDSSKFMNVSKDDFEQVPNIFQYLHTLITNPTNVNVPVYPCFERINCQSRDIILIVAYLYRVKALAKWITAQLECLLGCTYTPKTNNIEEIMASSVLRVLIKRGYNRSNIERLPISLYYLIAQFLEVNRNKPLSSFKSEVYELLLRPELFAHSVFNARTQPVYNTTKKTVNGLKEHSLSLRRKPPPEIIPKNETKQDESGMENMDTKLLRLRFPDDLRINDVKTFLNSCQPVLIDIVQAPNVSDHEFIEEQEKQLYALCIRTMALPIGRGMFTLRTSRPTATQTLPIPKLCLTGKEIHRGATIEIQQLEVPPNMSLWPTFHNGVAAGLRICSDTPDIDSTWITYNKPKGATEIPTEHAGFLMALGLNGHLKTLSFMSIYEYLVKCDEMTSLGLLLGISATHRGTMDTKTTKLLSVHIEALLPPTAVELDISQNIQVASLMGIGLVYQGTAKRHIAEVLLQEIGRPPGPEMENYVERESYALTAGLALGLVTLEQGEKSTALRDLDIPDTLHYYMVGGNKRSLVGAQKEKYKLPSFQIKEGDTVNIDVTAPGATLALGLMYFRTGNEAIANWMKPPETTYLLDFIRPDLLLLRIVARNLILWDDIDASTEWVHGQIPQTLSEIIKQRLQTDDQQYPADHEAQCQAYCNIVCGAAICIGLKYAGTGEEQAFAILNYLLKYFLKVSGRPFGDFAGKQTIENCTIMILLAVSMVMAGTGDIRVLRIIRMLRSRFSQCHVTYGSHMAIHMALGFLFLGAGRYTLSRSAEAIAALICSIFPKFPIHSNDNRYHLQAFRHLYVLAIEPRLFLPRDIDSGKLCLCEIHYLEKGKDTPIKVMAPCMLPELHTLEKVYVEDKNYWHIYFDRENWDILENILKSSGCIDIKQRAGCLSYLEDPNRLKSMLTQTLTTDKYTSWKIDPKSLLAFSTDQRISNLVNKFLLLSEHCSIDEVEPISTTERNIAQMLVLQTYDCLTHDKMHALPIFMDLMNLIINFDSCNNASKLWQIRILTAIITRRKPTQESDLLVSQDMLQSLNDRVCSRMADTLKENSHLILSYVVGASPERTLTEILTEVCGEGRQRIAKLIVFYDLPFKVLNNEILRRLDKTDYLQFVWGLKKQYPKLPSQTICFIAEILGLGKMWES
ncbi:anaphase-promoting complex subunit 1 isoform X2 [Toxorhynchites rutilus septentrionalis]|uniref:anaphase-promoting complex subunit 1 isoform X2 n=1 Tax=Toxorhynchites rutilus septentrionalis TaxID=329112 RepID=UPI00247AE443|nr:anaphase-promoting complex subunit 1 isoform X2 [Toxorhynchites rutilus septentrionalis]